MAKTDEKKRVDVKRVVLAGLGDPETDERLCDLACKAGVEVVLAGKWTLTPSHGRGDIAHDFGEVKALPGDLRIGGGLQLPGVDARDVEIALLYRVVERLEARAANTSDMPPVGGAAIGYRVEIISAPRAVGWVTAFEHSDGAYEVCETMGGDGWRRYVLRHDLKVIPPEKIPAAEVQEPVKDLEEAVGKRVRCPPDDEAGIVTEAKDGMLLVEYDSGLKTWFYPSSLEFVAPQVPAPT